MVVPVPILDQAGIQFMLAARMQELDEAEFVIHRPRRLPRSLVRLSCQALPRFYPAPLFSPTSSLAKGSAFRVHFPANPPRTPCGSTDFASPKTAPKIRQFCFFG